jgi:hypothetical protein
MAIRSSLRIAPFAHWRGDSIFSSWTTLGGSRSLRDIAGAQDVRFGPIADIVDHYRKK